MYTNLYMHVALLCLIRNVLVMKMCLLTSNHDQKVILESFHIKISNSGQHQLCEPRRHWQNIYCSIILSLLENPRLQNEAGYIKWIGRKKKGC